MGLSPQASFALITGGQTANTTCLAAARNAVLNAAGWDVEEQGLTGSHRVIVICSAARHGSIPKAVRFLGLGSNNLVAVDTDPEGRVLETALRKTLEAHPTVPKIVCLQAGDINTGACDDFVELIPICRQHKTWVHIDGAFGMWAAASPRYRHLVAGADRADSWAVDGHKWLNVPYDCGYAFVRDTRAHRAAMAQQASYLTHTGEARDQTDWNHELSRRARGFPTYAALRQLGREGVADLVNRCCAHARALVEGIGRLERAEVLHTPTINQGVVRFLAPGNTATDHEHDAHTDRVIQAIADSGEAFFSGTIFHGRRAMRVSVSNWRTSERDVARSIAAVKAALHQTH